MTLLWCPGQGRNCFGILGCCFRLGSFVAVYFVTFQHRPMVTLIGNNNMFLPNVVGKMTILFNSGISSLECNWWLDDFKFSQVIHFFLSSHIIGFVFWAISWVLPWDSSPNFWEYNWSFSNHGGRAKICLWGTYSRRIFPIATVRSYIFVSLVILK